MASRFGLATQISSNPQVLGEFGQSITYKAGGAGEGTSIIAIFAAEDLEFARFDDGEQSVRRAMVSLSIDASLETYGGIAAPARKDTVTINGDEWTVVSIESLDEDTQWAVLNLELRAHTERSAKKYRQPRG